MPMPQHTLVTVVHRYLSEPAVSLDVWESRRPRRIDRSPGPALLSDDRKVPFAIDDTGQICFYLTMKTMNWRPLLGLSLLITKGTLLGGEFESLFDGKTLVGWKAKEMGYWSIRDGAITGESSATTPCTSNQFMVWQGGELGDFELKLKFRVTGNGGNSGVQFRSKFKEDGLAGGYQADIFNSGAYLGGVCDELHERQGPELLKSNGQKTIIDASGKRSTTDLKVKATMKPQGEWNDYHIIAKGHHIILRRRSQ